MSDRGDKKFTRFVKDGCRKLNRNQQQPVVVKNSIDIVNHHHHHVNTNQTHPQQLQQQQPPPQQQLQQQQQSMYPQFEQRGMDGYNNFPAQGGVSGEHDVGHMMNKEVDTSNVEGGLDTDAYDDIDEQETIEGFTPLDIGYFLNRENIGKIRVSKFNEYMTKKLSFDLSVRRWKDIATKPAKTFTRMVFDDRELRAEIAREYCADRPNIDPNVVAAELKMKIHSGFVCGFSNNSPLKWGIQSKDFDSDSCTGGDWAAFSIPPTGGQYIPCRTPLLHQYTVGWNKEKDAFAEITRSADLSVKLIESDQVIDDHTLVKTQAPVWYVRKDGWLYNLILKNPSNIFSQGVVDSLKNPPPSIKLHFSKDSGPIEGVKLGSAEEINRIDYTIRDFHSKIPATFDNIVVDFTRPGRWFYDETEFEFDPRTCDENGDTDKELLERLKNMPFTVRVDIELVFKYF